MSRLTPEELAELRRVHVHAGRRVDSLFAGDWRSAVRGQGMEFEEVREYVPGDEPRHIDWNVTARTGHPFVKVFREERQLTVLLVVDVSGSTKVGSGGTDGRTDRKLQIARIAGSIAYAGIRARDQVGLLTFTDAPETWLAPRRTRGHVWRVIQEIFQASGSRRGTNIGAALQFLAKVQRRRAVVVLVSDFLAPEWERDLRTLAARHQVHAVLVHDPLDEGLAGLGLTEIIDAETGRARIVDGAVWSEPMDVDERVKALRRCGARAVAISTEDDPFHALHMHFQAMGHRR